MCKWKLHFPLTFKIGVFTHTSVYMSQLTNANKEKFIKIHVFRVGIIGGGGGGGRGESTGR